MKVEGLNVIPHSTSHPNDTHTTQHTQHTHNTTTRVIMYPSFYSVHTMANLWLTYGTGEVHSDGGYRPHRHLLLCRLLHLRNRQHLVPLFAAPPLPDHAVLRDVFHLRPLQGPETSSETRLWCVNNLMS